MDDCHLYSKLPGLTFPWKVSSVTFEPQKNTVELSITHEKETKLPCPLCGKGRMVYDHLRGKVQRELNRIDFTTFIHANPPVISCLDHGVEETLIPWAEKESRFSLRFETPSIRMLKNMGAFNFTEIMKLSQKHAWNILERAVKWGVMKHVNEVVDSTRNKENRELLKRGMKEYREEYEELKKSHLQTGKAHSMKENIRDLWNTPSIESAGK